MLRRQARLRREFLYKKSAESRNISLQERKSDLERSIESNSAVKGHLKGDAVKLHEKFKYGTLPTEEDDEYRYAGCIDPKIIITTSHEPSARLKMFAKELRLIFPNAQRMNRGKYEMKQLVHACRANEVSDFIVIHEHRGQPDNIIISHLPYGPTAFFNVSNVVMRHDIANIGTMSEQKPHLIFHNFKTLLGQRTKTILKHLFPVPKSNSKRVITFANHDDYISFRHHTYSYTTNNLELKEIGPRFQLKLYKIQLGTLDEIEAANTEWVMRPYMNTSSKLRFLSNENGWDQETDEPIT